MEQDIWFLEGYFTGEAAPGRLPLNTFPCLIGRQKGVNFIVPSNKASRLHAEITQEDNRIFLQDHNSSNGTFVNRKRITQRTEVQHGDVLHFADFEVRLIKETVKKSADPTHRSVTVIGMPALSDKMPAGVRELQELLAQKMIIPAYQPIIDAGTGEIYGYEILGRGTHPGLSRNPGPLFHIAESVNGLAMHLSRLFRDAGIATAATFDTQAKFFLNVHPDELQYTRLLLLQMEKIRRDYPELALVLEVHEDAVPSLADMKKLRRELDGLNIKLAYDDFGVGQSRFIELVEAPAHYLKFDISLVRDIDKAPSAKRDMIELLVTMARNMGINTLAEGLEREEEVDTCRQMGFDYIQGFYYGRPTEGSIQPR